MSTALTETATLHPLVLPARADAGDERHLQRGDTVLVTAAQHIDSGELCGHRPGLLGNTAGLRRWRTLRPGSLRTITDNAEENRPMLPINESIGFTPIAYEGAWKKELS